MDVALAKVRTERAIAWTDLAVFAGLVASIYVMVTVAREWTGPLKPVAEIHTEAGYLPLYALFSLTRGLCAYGVSFLFTMVMATRWRGLRARSG